MNILCLFERYISVGPYGQETKHTDAFRFRSASELRQLRVGVPWATHRNPRKPAEFGGIAVEPCGPSCHFVSLQSMHLMG